MHEDGVGGKTCFQNGQRGHYEIPIREADGLLSIAV